MELNKEEMSAKLNELLGLKEKPIAFEKLSKEELQRLDDALEALSLGGGLFGKKLLNRPVGEIMDMRLRDVFKEMKEGKGPLGLGLIGLLRGERRQGNNKLK